MVHGVSKAPPEGSSRTWWLSARLVTRDEVNDAFREEAASDRYHIILEVSDDPVVSADIVGDPDLGGGLA